MSNLQNWIKQKKNDIFGLNTSFVPIFVNFIHFDPHFFWNIQKGPNFENCC